MAKIFAIEIIALSLSVILFFAILLKDLHAVEENNLVSSKFAENYELRHVVLSDVNLLPTQKTRSKLKCATLCDLEEKCKMFRFEAPSRSCYMYREVTTGGCFGFTSRNVSSYYTHLGRVASWLLLYFSPYEKKVYIWRERENFWEEDYLPDKMESARIDPTTWRLYWGLSRPNTGIHISDVRGNNKMTLVQDISSTSLDVDLVHRRLFHDGDKADFVGVVDLDNDVAGVFQEGDEKPGHIHGVRVLPELRFVFWIQNGRLWRRHYDESKAHHIPAYQETDEAFTTDHLYNRLIWLKANSTDLLFTDAWGEDERIVTLSGLNKSATSKLITHNGNIYFLNYFSFPIQMFNCKGQPLKTLFSTNAVTITDNRDLVWIPEQVYYKV